MPFFILLNLILSLLAQSGSSYQALFTTHYSLYLGNSIMFISLCGALFKQKLYAYWFDLFATGALLAWFSSWHRVFLDDAPMFKLFPLFFAFFNALLSLIYVNKTERLDAESVELLNYVAVAFKFHPFVSGGIVFVSLFLTKHYLLFPIAVSLFIISFILKSCAEHLNCT